MKKYEVIVSSVTIGSKSLRKGKTVALDDKTAERLLKLKAIKLVVKKGAKAK